MLRARLAAGGLAGLLLTLSLPPLDWWPSGLVGAAVLYWAVGSGRPAWPERSGRWRDRVAVAGAAGAAFYGPGLFWATGFHAVGWVLLVVMEGGIFALMLSAVPGAAAPPWARAVAFPAALLLAEAVRGRWPFGGLPLAGIDLGQVDGPLLGTARVGGHLLLVGVVGLVGVGLAELVDGGHRRQQGRGRLTVGAACVALALAVGVAGHLAPDGRRDGTLRVAAVQGGGARGLRAADRDQAPVFDAHVAASQGVQGPVDLVLWPEDVIDIEEPLPISPEEQQVSDLSRALRTTLVAGVVEDLPGGRRFRNSAVAWGPDGRMVDSYEKVHRVPFGEYVPLRSLIERVADVSDVPRDAIVGRGPGVLETAVGRFGVVISYEVFFADRARAAARAGGRLLLVPTNASSYSSSQVPAQEVAAARLRGVETGRWVVQAAPTGYSGVFDHRGRVRDLGPLGDRAVVHAEVELRRGSTWATGIGQWPLAGAAAAVLLLAALRTRRPRP